MELDTYNGEGVRDISPDEIGQLSRYALEAYVLRVQKEKNELALMATRDQKFESMLNAKTTIERIETRIAQKKAFGLFYIDIDFFKQFNDTYDHLEGDNLLRLLENLLNETFRRDTDEVGDVFEIGRMGGDEFLVVMAGLEGGDKRSSNMYEQMDNIYNRLRWVEGRLLDAEPRAKDLGVGFSIGCALFDPAYPVDAETLIKQSEEAMREEKPLGSR